MDNKALLTYTAIGLNFPNYHAPRTNTFIINMKLGTA